MKQPSNNEPKQNSFDDILDQSNHSFEDNVIFIHGVIDESFNVIIKWLRNIIRQQSKLKNGKIVIYIDSPWWLLDTTLSFIALINQAKSQKIKIITIVTALAWSCASLIAIQGQERYASVSAYHIIHYPRGMFFVNSPDQFDNESRWNKFFNETLVGIYKEFTKIKDLEKKMAQDNYWIYWSDDLIKYWLADHKLEDSPIIF